MDKLLNRLSLNLRVTTLVIIPVLTTTIFAIFLAISERKEAIQAERMYSLAAFAPAISGLVHELQKERGRTAGFIGSGGKQNFQTLMNTQREATNTAYQAFEQADAQFEYAKQDPSIASLTTKAKAKLKQLAKTRREINQLDFTLPEMARYYTGTIADLLSIIELMSHLSDNADISRKITSYTGLLQAKERAGLERAMGNAGFGSGQFSPLVYKRFIELMTAQDTFLSVFQHYSDSQDQAYYTNTVKGEAVDKVQEMRTYVLDTQGNVQDAPYDANFWFQQITLKINLLKQVEDFINADIYKRTQELAASSNRQFYLFTSLMTLGGILLLALSFAVLHSINAPLKKLMGVMSSLSKGTFDIDIPLTDYGSIIGQI